MCANRPNRCGSRWKAPACYIIAAPCSRFYDGDELRCVGYPETAELVRSVTGAADVVVFDHNIRHGGRRGKMLIAGDVKPPVFHIHTDFSGKSAQARAAAVLGSTERIRSTNGGYQRLAAAR